MGAVEEIRALLQRAEAELPDPVGAAATVALGRLDEPLRVALVGQVKAGKSTLLNALVGEELAPTDAGECTRIVTWYRDGVTYRVTVEGAGGERVAVPFRRHGGALDVDLGGRDPATITRMVVDWPSAALRAVTLIDTPGLGSTSLDVSARTTDALLDAQAAEADAVVYLLRHLHATDLRFLEDFQAGAAGAGPVDAVAVLSRADEVGAGRLDALASARQVAARYEADPRVRRLCRTVVPVAGLVAQAAVTLTEAEFRAVARLAALARGDLDALLLTADRFVAEDAAVDLAAAERAHLAERLGLFGVRLSVALVRQGAARDAAALARELLARSGLAELRAVLAERFGASSALLRARSALRSFRAALEAADPAVRRAWEADVERIVGRAHEFAELRVLDALGRGSLAWPPEVAAEAERLLGPGPVPVRTGLDADADADAVAAALLAAVGAWRARAESPLAGAAERDASGVVVRTVEGLLVAVRAVPGSQGS